MKKPGSEEEKLPIQVFEELYILTFKDIFRHVSLLMDSDHDILELFIQTYEEVYKQRDHWPDAKNQVIWIKKIADNLAENKFDIKKDRINRAYKKSAKTRRARINVSIDETSVFMDIEERLQGLDDNENQDAGRGKMSRLQGILSIAILSICICVLLTGIGKIRDQLSILNKPFVKPLEEPDNGESEKKKEERIVIANKVVYLSEAGKVLYSLPLEEKDLAGKNDAVNSEIQKKEGWTYYLPCPEQKDSSLSDVAPFLYHTLYRLDSQGEKIEIIAQEVEDYTFWEDNIYISQFGRIHQISAEQTFDNKVPEIYPEVINNEIYLYHSLGKSLVTEADGSIRFGDRIFKMSSSRIEDVEPAVRSKEDITYYLKNKDIYRNINGQEEVYVDVGQNIDSFCIVDDWLYFSAYIRTGGSGTHYSELYRILLTEDKKPEKIHKEFTGRIRNMYFSEEENQIYADYTPKNWKSNYGTVIIISTSGQISYLNDEEQRQAEETTGNDMLEFVMVFDDQVYCFWKDCIWEPGETPVAIWRKVLVIPN